MLTLHLLQDASAEHIGVYVAAEDKHGGGIDEGSSQSDDGVGGPRPNGGVDRQRLAADSVEAVCQVSSALLVAYLEHAHLPPCLESVQ